MKAKSVTVSAKDDVNCISVSVELSDGERAADAIPIVHALVIANLQKITRPQITESSPGSAKSLGERLQSKG